MAAARAVTPSNNDLYAASTSGAAAPLSHGHSAASHNAAAPAPGNTEAMDPTHASGNPGVSSPLAQSLRPNGGKFEENFDASVRGSSILEGDGLQRSGSTGSNLNQGAAPARSGTLKKKNSLSKKNSLKRSGSKRSLHAGSITGVNAHEDASEPSSLTNVFFTPVPTTGSPTEILANRFQAWRKLLKDLITYFREIQASYEHRAKALLKVSNVINNTNMPSMFLAEGGLNDANRILRDYHKQSVTESNKARDVQNEVIAQLNGLRADLAQKIKEIKGLSGDFKNSVEKEKEGTRRAVASLTEALAAVDTDPAAINGKGDPYVVRLNVDRQVERQIDEENYLHGAYLNLEGSGRQLEAIVVGEIQKAYNALAGILKRDADEAYSTVDRLRNGPIAIPRELEWTQFIENDSHFVSPRIPLRRAEDIEYPGKHHPAAVEVRAGMLERKSKYLKSYTPGWYVLSPTHLHEFKSADRLYTQPPVMSLYLPDQKLGSHSQPGSSSHKFMIKGRQTGSMHRGHSWVFRAESYDTMLAWFEDIKNLTEKRGEERNAFVRRHARSISAGSNRSVSSDGAMDEDEADRVPYSAGASAINQAAREPPPQRPSPGGRFPSDIQVNRDLRIPPSPSSGASEVEHNQATAAGSLHPDQTYFTKATPQQEHQTTTQTRDYANQGHPTTTTNEQSIGYNENYASSIQPTPQPSVRRANPLTSQVAQPAQPAEVPPAPTPSYLPTQPDLNDDNTYSDRSAMIAGGALAGVGAGALATDAYYQHSATQEQQEPPLHQNVDMANQYQPLSQYQQSSDVQPLSQYQQSGDFQPLSQYQQSDTVQPLSQYQQSDTIQPLSQYQQPGADQPWSQYQQSGSVQPWSQYPQSDAVQPLSQYQQSGTDQPLSQYQQPGADQLWGQYQQPTDIAQEPATYAPTQQNIIAPVPIAHPSSLLHVDSGVASQSTTSLGTSLVDTPVGAYDDETPLATPLAAPRFMRQDTDVSASDLPVPGKYPKSQIG